MLLKNQHRGAGAAIIGGILLLSLTGCIEVNPGPVVPTISVDFNKSVEQQKQEFVSQFKEIYCPIRNTPVADAVADGAKETWNRIVASSQGQNVGIPTFDPRDPALCR